MLCTPRIALVACLLVVGCSKKKEAAGSGSAAAPATNPAPATTGSAAAPATNPAPAAAASAAGCADCQKFTSCCEALVATPNSDVDKSDCEANPGQTRLEFCTSASPEMQPDANSTCKDRLADLQKAHPDVAACK
jgi:hypothetical protein